MSAKQTSTYRHLYFRYDRIPMKEKETLMKGPKLWNLSGLKKCSLVERRWSVPLLRGMAADDAYTSLTKVCVLIAASSNLQNEGRWGGDLSNLRNKRPYKVLFCVCDVMTVPYYLAYG